MSVNDFDINKGLKVKTLITLYSHLVPNLSIVFFCQAQELKIEVLFNLSFFKEICY
jgi:hypothetical protein